MATITTAAARRLARTPHHRPDEGAPHALDLYQVERQGRALLARMTTWDWEHDRPGEHRRVGAALQSLTRRHADNVAWAVVADGDERIRLTAWTGGGAWTNRRVEVHVRLHTAPGGGVRSVDPAGTLWTTSGDGTGMHRYTIPGMAAAAAVIDVISAGVMLRLCKTGAIPSHDVGGYTDPDSGWGGGAGWAAARALGRIDLQRAIYEALDDAALGITYDEWGNWVSGDCTRDDYDPISGPETIEARTLYSGAQPDPEEVLGWRQEGTDHYGFLTRRQAEAIPAAGVVLEEVPDWEVELMEGTTLLAD